MPNQCRTCRKSGQSTAERKLLRWALLLAQTKALRDAIARASRDGVIDGLTAGNAASCLDGVQSDLLESLPAE